VRSVLQGSGSLDTHDGSLIDTHDGGSPNTADIHDIGWIDTDYDAAVVDTHNSVTAGGSCPPPPDAIGIALGCRRLQKLVAQNSRMIAGEIGDWKDEARAMWR
jgi:hypothetical protein